MPSHRYLLILALTSSSLACAAEPPPPTLAPTPISPSTSTWAAAGELLQLELHDGERSEAFVLPLDGELSSWTKLFEDPHFCQLESRVEPDGVHVHVHCAANDHGQDPDFELRGLVRAPKPASSHVLGELVTRDGRDLKVIATML